MAVQVDETTNVVFVSQRVIVPRYTTECSTVEIILFLPISG